MWTPTKYIWSPFPKKISTGNGNNNNSETGALALSLTKTFEWGLKDAAKQLPSLTNNKAEDWNNHGNDASCMGTSEAKEDKPSNSKPEIPKTSAKEQIWKGLFLMCPTK